jgi:glycosyltransferase involved in cell wall biosynthesis
MATVLCVGPQGMPSTGQALATDTWVACSAHNVLTINNNFEGVGHLKRIIKTLVLPLLVFRHARRARPVAMYLSLKRSVLGAAADLSCVIAYQLVVAGPVVVHLHGADLASVRQSRLADALFRCLWCVVSDVIVLAPRMAEQLEGLPQRRLHIVNNFSQAFATIESVVEKANNFQGEPLRVLYLSNIMFSKGFSYLIDAVRELCAEGHLVTLTLAGKPLGDSYISAEEALVRLKSGGGEGLITLVLFAARRNGSFWKLLTSWPCRRFIPPRLNQ